MNGTQPKVSSIDDVEDPALVEEAEKIFSEKDREDEDSRAHHTVPSSSKDVIPFIYEVQHAPPEPNTNCDLVIVSDSGAFSSGRDVVTRQDVSFAKAAFPNARLMRFDISSLVDTSHNVTASTEAARLFSRLLHLKATDIKNRASSGLKRLLPQNYRIIFITKGIGAAVVKECLMKSRSSNSPLLSSVWESCRGIVCFDPMDGEAIRQMRRELLPPNLWENFPVGLWERYKESWWSSEKKRIARMSDIIDEVEKIEEDYEAIAREAPPRFSLPSKSAGAKRVLLRWNAINSIAKESKSLVPYLEKWSFAVQTAPIQWPLSTSDGSRLLSLDGGGVKGISSLMLLQAIMQKVQELEAPAGTSFVGKELSPLKYFDLTGGTSTGGLIGIMLCRLGMSISETIQAYEDMAKTIFAPRIFWGKVNVQEIPGVGNVMGNIVLKFKVATNRPQFDGSILEEVVQKLTIEHSESGGKATRLLEDPMKVGHGKMFMCATRTDRQEACLFRSYRVPTVVATVVPSQNTAGDGNKRDCNPQYEEPPLELGFEDISIGDACRATSSAPTYFESKVVHDVKFWDGGMLNNNPIDQVWDARDDTGKPGVSCVLSLGCSYAVKSKSTIFNLINTIIQATSYTTNTEAKHKDFERMIQRENLKKKESERIQYFRLNVPTASESINLDDWKKMDSLKEYTTKYLKTREAQDMVLRCAHSLARLQQKTLLDLVGGTEGANTPPKRRLPRSSGPVKLQSPGSESSHAAISHQTDGTANLEAPKHERRSSTTPAGAPYMIRLWSVAYHKYFQTKPFIEPGCSVNIISESFLRTIGVDEESLDATNKGGAKNASGGNVETSGSIKLSVHIFRRGHPEPDIQDLLFNVKSMSGNVVGDVLLGHDVCA